MKRLHLTSLVYLIGMIWLVFVGGASIWLLARPHSHMAPLTGAQVSRNPPVSPVKDETNPPLSETNPAENRFPQLVQEVTRRLSTDSQPYIFSDEQLDALREQSLQLSQAVKPYLRELNQSQVSQVVITARRQGLEPGLVVYIALAEWMENPRQDFVPSGNKVIETIGPLANRYGVELVDKSLLLIAAYQIAQSGNSPHTMFRERLTGSLANETGRTLWALHRAGKISNATLAFAFRALAIGCVVQNPAFWGIAEIPLVIA